MAARPSWRGQIRLALVAIPVEIFPATKAGKSIAFHQVHEPSGQRVRYEKVVPGIGPVDRDEILKGYEVEKGEYVLLDPEEIEKVKLESRKTLELTQFVDFADIDPIYYDKPYYRRPRRRPRRGSVRRAARGAAQGEEGRHRPARDARAGICRQPEGVRARDGARDAALRRRGQQGGVLFPRHRRRQARPRPARPGADADREEGRATSTPRIREPLHRGAARR